MHTFKRQLSRVKTKHWQTNQFAVSQLENRTILGLDEVQRKIRIGTVILENCSPRWSYRS